MKITYIDENGMKLAEPGCLPMVPLRDYFAAAALTGLLSSPLLAENEVHVLAKEAYATADAMMKAGGGDANTTK